MVTILVPGQMFTEVWFIWVYLKDATSTMLFANRLSINFLNQAIAILKNSLNANNGIILFA